MALPRISWHRTGSAPLAENVLPAAYHGFIKNRSKDLLTETALKDIVLEPPVSELMSVLKEVGTPFVEAAESPVEEAVGLLKFAAEVEHALMVQYLYAAASIQRDTPEGNDCWTKIMSVAAQEMGHLISVQNLLLLVGGPANFHFGRDSIRATNPENPIPLVLECISKRSLTKYIAAEMPAHIDDATLSKRVAQLITDLGDIKLHRVGALYAKLFWLFQPNDDPFPPMNLTPDPDAGLVPYWHLKPTDFKARDVLEKYKISPDEWFRGSVRKFILETVDSAASACNLIADISEQGEGLSVEHDSHFYEFIELLDSFEGEKLKVEPLPEIDLTKSPIPISSNQYAAYWVELMDIRYSLLITDVWHAAAVPIGHQRKEIIKLAYDNMKFLTLLIAQLLLLRKESNIKDAAPLFQLLYEDFPDTDQLRCKRHRDLLDKQKKVIDNIKNSAEFQECADGECTPVDFNGFDLIGNIEQNDLGRTSSFPAI